MTSAPLKRRASLVTTCRDDGELPFLSLDLVEAGTGRLLCEGPRTPMPSSGAALVAPGDVLFGKLRPYLAKSVLVFQPSYASTELLAIRPVRELDPKFLSYVVQARPFIEWTAATSEGTKMPRTSWEKVGSYQMPNLVLAEQRVVAEFLDTETARIDALIAKKRRMIGFVKERLRAERAYAVLRGHDPVHPKVGDAPPYGWSSVALGVLIRLHRGYDLPSDAREAGEIPIVSSGGISGTHSVPMAEPPGVVTGRYGTVGEVFFLDVPYWPLNTTLFVSDFRGNDPRWVFHLLSALPLDYDAAKSAVTGINRNVVGGLRVARPPLTEQRQIANHLDSIGRWTDAVVGRIERQVTLLDEHRQALITAAVTGEMDVPGVAA